MLQLPQAKVIKTISHAILFKVLTLIQNMPVFIHSLELFGSVWGGRVVVYCLLVYQYSNWYNVYSR